MFIEPCGPRAVVSNRDTVINKIDENLFLPLNVMLPFSAGNNQLICLNLVNIPHQNLAFVHYIFLLMQATHHSKHISQIKQPCQLICSTGFYFSCFILYCIDKVSTHLFKTHDNSFLPSFLLSITVPRISTWNSDWYTVDAK